MWFQSWALLVVCQTVCVVSELGSVSCVSDCVCVVSELGSVSCVSDCVCCFRAGLC